MTVFQKLGVCAAITIMFVGTFSGCCGGKPCGLFGGGNAAAAPEACPSCSSPQAGYSQPGYSQPGFSQPGSGYSQPSYSQPAAGSGYSQPGYSQPAYSPGPSAGSGTSAPIFGGGSGGR